MRLALILALLPFPTLAWEFTPDPICRLSHENLAAEIIITFDARLAEYSLAVAPRAHSFPNAPSFTMTFEGGDEISIGTTNHVLSDYGRRLTVRDTGFGNVLDGLEYNNIATARSGHIAYEFDLTNAAPAVRAFRACPTDLPATS
jgi:hypothetical protein